MTNCLIKSGESYLVEFDYPRKTSPVFTDIKNEATEFLREEALIEIKHLIDDGWLATIVGLDDSNISISVEDAKKKKAILESTIKELIDKFEEETNTTVKSLDIDEIWQTFGKKRTFSIKIDVNL